MRIKFVKLSIPDNEDKHLINNDMSDSFKLGDELTVFGISINQNFIYYDIIWGIQIIGVPSELFEIVDNRVSKYWKFEFKNDGWISLWPELFYEECFHDRFSDWDIDLRVKFQDLKKLMLDEFNYPNDYEEMDNL